MAQEVYGNFEFAQKAYTRGSDIGKGQIAIGHLNPAFFLETRLIKLHTHSGVDSLPLGAEATPEMVKGYNPREREERGIATWTGGSSTSGSLVLTYVTPFQEAPTVIVTAADGNANIIVGIGSVTATSVTIYWRDETAAGHTSLSIHYLVKGR